jgi:UDP-2,3-diacylglucosamine hydrolase
MPVSRYFVSDFHFGAKKEQDDIIIDSFEAFCSSLKDGSHLYILGDFFDFWIEHKYTVRADFIEIYSILTNVRKRGIEISMIRGNHDFIRGSFFKKNGIGIFDDKIEFEVNKKKVCCLHGDGISGDFTYGFMKSIFRNSFFQFLYKTIHPTISIFLAQLVSKLSRKKNIKTVKSDARKEAYRKYALGFAEKFNFDILIMGHSHIPDLLKANGRIYANSGVWFEEPIYILFEENKLFLKKFCGDLSQDIILDEMEDVI